MRRETGNTKALFGAGDLQAPCGISPIGNSRELAKVRNDRRRRGTRTARGREGTWEYSVDLLLHSLLLEILGPLHEFSFLRFRDNETVTFTSFP